MKLDFIFYMTKNKYKLRLLNKIACIFLLFGFSQTCSAGYDVTGLIEGVQINADGIRFGFHSGGASKYCADAWNGMNFYIPATNPTFPYYYTLIVSAFNKKQTIYMGNISVFNGTTPCDVSQTGYGIVVLGS